MAPPGGLCARRHDRCTVSTRIAHYLCMHVLSRRIVRMSMASFDAQCVLSCVLAGQRAPTAWQEFVQVCARVCACMCMLPTAHHMLDLGGVISSRLADSQQV